MRIIEQAAENAHVLTYGAAGTTVVFWGLSLGDLGVLVSMVCTVCGVLIQVASVVYKLRGMDRRQAVTENVAIAAAVSNRATATQAAVADAKADVAIALATPKQPT